MPSGTKRKAMEELGGQVLSAAVGGVVDRAMSAAVGRYEARASVDDQLDRLDTLSIMVHSAVEVAEGVHIRSWWLRRWLWKLRDAALDADEVLRLFRRRWRRRADEEAAAAAGGAQSRNTLWSAAWHAFLSAKNLLFGHGDDDGVDVERLRRMVARLEREAMGLGDFLKTLHLEIRRSLPPVHSDIDDPPSIMMAVVPASRNTAVSDGEKGLVYQWLSRLRVKHGNSYISHDEYVASVRKMGLLLVTQRVLGALDKLMLIRKKPVAPPAAASSQCPLLELDTDTAKLHDMVLRIERAVVTSSLVTSAEFAGGERSWLALWRGELQDVASRAKRVLLHAVPVGDAGADSADDNADLMSKRTARILETAEAHPRRRSRQRGPPHPRIFPRAGAIAGQCRDVTTLAAPGPRHSDLAGWTAAQLTVRSTGGTRHRRALSSASSAAISGMPTPT